MLLLLIIEAVLFFINPVWAAIGAPVCVVLYILGRSAGKNSDPRDYDDEDEEFEWDLEDLN